MPLHPTVTSNIRPNRLTDTKNEKYHLDYARWTLSSLHDPLHRHFIRKAIINWNFYKNRQWMFPEDLTHFFTDESGDIRHRIKFTKNLIRPMVEAYRGSAIQQGFNARVRSISEFVVNRREKELNRMLFFTDAAQQLPKIKGEIERRMPIGQTRGETEGIFENMWVDNHEDTLNNLLRAVEARVDAEEIKVNILLQLVLTGLGLYRDFEKAGHYEGGSFDPMFFYFDHTAMRPDLTDGSYMGEWGFWDTPFIFEKYNKLSGSERQAIEKHSQNNSDIFQNVLRFFYGVSNSRINVYRSFWRDTEAVEFGWVTDEFGYPHFTEINTDDSKFVDADLIDAPTEQAQKKMEGKKKVIRYQDVLRFCEFIPKEEISTNIAGQEDIVLAWGEDELRNRNKFMWPYKAYAWAYDKGEILSPIDDVIDPQRFVNRMLSASEALVNRAGGSGPVIAREAIDPNDGEADIKRDIKASNPIVVDVGKLGSVSNAIGKYDSSLPAGAQFGFNLVREMGTLMQDVTGNTGTLLGTEGGQKELVGVLESRVARGNQAQEPVFFALNRILLQAHNSMVELGRRIYVDSPRKLAIMTGDRGAQEIIITRDMLLSDFRLEVQRTTPDESQEQAANSVMIQLLQLGLLDRKHFSNLFNRANIDQVADAVRKFIGELTEAEKLQKQQEGEQLTRLAQQQQDLVEKVEQKEKAQEFREDISEEKDRQSKLDTITLRETFRAQREK